MIGSRMWYTCSYVRSYICMIRIFVSWLLFVGWACRNREHTTHIDIAGEAFNFDIGYNFSTLVGGLARGDEGRAIISIAKLTQEQSAVKASRNRASPLPQMMISAVR